MPGLPGENRLRRRETAEITPIIEIQRRESKMTQFQSAEPLDPNSWIALHVLAAHGFGRPPFGADSPETRIANLQRMLADELVLDDVGIPHVSRNVARQLVTERDGRQAAECERRQREQAEARARPNRLRERVKALQEAQKQFDCTDMPALARAIAADPDSAFNRSDRALSEMMSGGLTFHRIRRETNK
jgi:hypothetical protein